MVKYNCFFIFFSHINIVFSQNNNIIPTPKEQKIENGFIILKNTPKIRAVNEFNYAGTLLKNAFKKLGFANDKENRNRIEFSHNKNLNKEEYVLKIKLNKLAQDKIIIMPGSGINLKNINLFKNSRFIEIHGSFKNWIN